MHITTVELENIKSHIDSKFEFQPGKIAITGENGAGKTSIIEGIAWALFDHLEYKKEEFVRRGAKKGIVRVTFESGLDEREYTVLRDTDTAYYVFDPMLGGKFANKKDRLVDKKEEVARFIRQHFGVEPGTDLKSLFRQAIGVPQGTFTAIFLEGAAERKAAFDKLLKVEEYRQGAEKLRETAHFIDTMIVESRLQLARMETEISRAETAEKEFAELAEQTRVLSADLESLGKEVSAKREQAEAFDRQEKRATELTALADRLRSEKSRADLVFQQKESELKTVKEAAEKLELVRADNDRHLEILGRLKELERERQERDRLRSELAKVEAAIVNVKADQKLTQESFENALKAHREIETLKPKAIEQKSLEKEIEVLRNQLAQAKAVKNQIQSLDGRLERLRENYKQNQAQLKEMESEASPVGELADLEKRDSALVLQIASLRASLERDQKFQAEIENGLCPILSQKCLNLKEGETLEGFVTSQFSELKAQITTLEKEKIQVAANLHTAREAEKIVVSLESLKARAAELSDEGTRLKEEKEALRKQLEGIGEIEKQLAAAERKLEALDNPRAKIRFHENETAREADLRQDITKIEKNLERLGSDRRLFVEQLDEYKDLDDQWKQLVAGRDATTEAHRTFLSHEAAAGSVGEREAELATAWKALSKVAEDFANAERQALDAGKDYDREQHLSTRASLLDVEKKHAGTQASLQAAKGREERLASELRHFAEIRETMKSELLEKERLEKVSEMTAFIRETLKESAPRVARNYVFLVSVEASQMFSEITGNVERTLKWGEDYGITLEEDGFGRPFVGLSGGEQMAAALAVRLALLKQLSDIRIAFFDEPTTNMDATRRENLAMQISQIKNFDQLFVISHDDTFEGYVDTVLNLEIAEIR